MREKLRLEKERQRKEMEKRGEEEKEKERQISYAMKKEEIQRKEYQKVMKKEEEERKLKELQRMEKERDNIKIEKEEMERRELENEKNQAEERLRERLRKENEKKKEEKTENDRTNEPHIVVSLLEYWARGEEEYSKRLREQDIENEMIALQEAEMEELRERERAKIDKQEEEDKEHRDKLFFEMEELRERERAKIEKQKEEDKEHRQKLNLEEEVAKLQKNLKLQKPVKVVKSWAVPEASSQSKPEAISNVSKTPQTSPDKKKQKMSQLFMDKWKSIGTKAKGRPKKEIQENNEKIKKLDEVRNILTEVAGPSHIFEQDNQKIKRKNLNLRTSKGGDKNLKRVRENEVKKDNYLSELEDLHEILGNPIEEMSLDEKKRLTLHEYLKLFPIMAEDTSSFVANNMEVHKETVNHWVREFRVNKEIEKSKRGKHSKCFSPIQDALFLQDFRQYVKGHNRVKGKANMTCQSLAAWVNEDLGITDDSKKYSERTICDWLHYAGFTLKTEGKVIYFDGHEREDVIQDRKRFDQGLKEACKKINKINPISLEVIENPNSTHVFVNQDEKAHKSNEVNNTYWSDGRDNFPPPKSEGVTVMTSGKWSKNY